MARAALVLVTAVLLCALTGCGDAKGPGGSTAEEERPCPSASGPSGAPSAPAPSGSPGDSRTHAVAPDGRGCVIESGLPAMPEDP
ncbi:hypothetical protein ACIGO8_17100 [Streptomyces sp. NPDC053493]|uniref:hypothetical protein n=1 Tax=Streptomyces sp. NPDC053493 TaxID=3365705 RepID=UPI0037D7680C